ncbi:hypothetical protein ACOMHN_017990 [Nucella lapillus]
MDANSIVPVLTPRVEHTAADPRNRRFGRQTRSKLPASRASPSFQSIPTSAVEASWLCFDRRCVTWNLPATCTLEQPAPGKCCQTPKCPPGINIVFPPGYVPNQ